MSLSRRQCWALGAVCLGAGLVTPWAAARMSEVEVVPVVKTVRLRPALVRLPGGSFLMGSPEGEEYAEDDEQPQRLVELPAFSLCQTEVTQAHYEAVIGTNPSNCSSGCGDNLPVQSVSWVDAVAYLNRLTELESEALVADGKSPLSACYTGSDFDVRWVSGCTGYRLPTEAEWEYAARAGTTTSWSFGEDPADLGEYAWYDGNAKGEVHPVGSKKANPWGLYDLHGNVYEWVWDRYDLPESVKWGNRSVMGRALRGGSFFNSPEYVRSAHRYGLNPEVRFGLGGIRCARGADPQH